MGIDTILYLFYKLTSNIQKSFIFVVQDHKIIVYML